LRIEISDQDLRVAVDAIKTLLDITYQGRPRTAAAKLDREAIERVYRRLRDLEKTLETQGPVGEDRAAELKRYKRESRRHGEM
jgi:hypothetical protein